VSREGFEWGVAVLDQWLAELQEMACDLESPQLKHYLIVRKMLLAKQKDGIVQNLQQAEALLAPLKQNLGLQGGQNT
jgi:hypothetical protein